MSVRIINGKVYKNGAFSEEELVLKEGKIVSAQDGDAEEVYDAKGNYVVPGFIDVHTHGGAGVDVNAADQQGFEKIGHFFATQGTTSWLSSILTDTKEQTLKTIKEAVKHQEAQKNGHENCADLLGIHLEGPFLSPEYKGAMPEHLLISPDLDLLKEKMQEADIFCDATGVGMHPLEDLSNIPDTSFFRPDLIVTDTVYAPRETVMMKQAKEAGCTRVYNGMSMMLFQALIAIELYTGKSTDVEYMKEQLGI